MPSLLNIDGVDVHVEGQGQDTIVMIHGWPDTHRVWDAQVEAFKTRLRCVRFTLPGYDVTKPRRPVSLAEMTQTIEHIVDAVSPARPVILMLHDWGCFFGYQFYVHHPQRVERIVGIDVGDVGNPEFVKSLPLISKLMVLSYQLWLAAAWRIGGGLGRRMTRFMAKALKAPGDPALISSDMNYPYYIRWTRTYGGYAHALPFEPACPMLFVYGKKKPLMFHERTWAERLAARPGSQVKGMDTDHWVMCSDPQGFNRTVADWLATSS
jgi:pimeloyl-ACP methyl ester carboxylesterase